MKILVTGATGFVGRHVCKALAAAGHRITAAVRSSGATVDGAEGVVSVGSVGEEDSWRVAIDGHDAVVHLLGHAHRGTTADQPDNPFRTVNVEATRALTAAAADAGVERFVFLSSVKAAGERSQPNRPLLPDDPPQPEDDYGRSKLEAERELAALAKTSGLRPVILRPPLIYGPGVKGNFLRLIRLAERRLPLPFASVDNRRSFIGIANLSSAIERTLITPSAGGTFFVSDGDDVSTPDLIRRLSRAFGHDARLWPAPPGTLRLLAGLAGQAGAAERLLGSLQVEAQPFRDAFAWQPAQSLDDGLRETVDWYRRR